ncbi:MAG: S-layer homology domain-containing protein [Tumebacillaceae bacterium]
MRKWLVPVVAAAISCGTALPAMADTTSSPANDHAYINSNISTQTVGSSADLRLVFAGAPTTSTTPDLQVQTTLGTLNGQASSVTVSPVNGSYQDLTLTSTKVGTATISVYENGILIGSTQVTFVPGALGSITVQATPSNQVIGGTSILMITAYDIYGNLVADDTPGTTFNVSTTLGQLTPGNGIHTASNGSVVTVGTHNGSAQALLTNAYLGTANVTIADTNALPNDVTINGNTGVRSVTVPVSFTYAQSVTTTPFVDFKDTTNRSAIELASERELSAIGVLHGDLNHYYFPTSTMKRSEFAQVVAQYMGLGAIATNFAGMPTKFADVNTSDWFNGAVAADSAFGYIHGDGTKFYPNQSISYAEVAMILLNNLGVTVNGSWPDNAMSGGQTYGLFAGLGSFNANEAATRGDVAIMVRNALHLVPPTGGTNTNGKTIESEFLGYTWNGAEQQTTVTAIPGSGMTVGNELLVQTATQTLTLHLANAVQLVGATSLTDLMNKHINYLTNAMGVVTYIEVTA